MLHSLAPAYATGGETVQNALSDWRDVVNPFIGTSDGNTGT
jgi:hypothetical protein